MCDEARPHRQDSPTPYGSQHLPMPGPAWPHLALDGTRLATWESDVEYGVQERRLAQSVPPWGAQHFC
jgi:hypothetical protein